MNLCRLERNGDGSIGVFEHLMEFITFKKLDISTGTFVSSDSKEDQNLGKENNAWMMALA